jgi:hypothetical protein
MQRKVTDNFTEASIFQRFGMPAKCDLRSRICGSDPCILTDDKNAFACRFEDLVQNPGGSQLMMLRFLCGRI